MRVLFALTGSIACYKAAGALSRLSREGHEVQAIATSAALRFVGAATLEALTRRPVFSDLWEPGRSLDHIDLARWADVALVCPATAHSIARLALGLADDALGTLYLAWELDRKPFWVFPAMNQQMWRHPAVAGNLDRLRLHGVRIHDPASGPQACGEVGPGRLPEPAEIVATVLSAAGGLEP